MSTHDRLFEAAIEAINAVFCDTSVPPGEVRASLEGLVTEVEMRLDALYKDE